MPNTIHLHIVLRATLAQLRIKPLGQAPWRLSLRFLYALSGILSSDFTPRLFTVPLNTEPWSVENRCTYPSVTRPPRGQGVLMMSGCWF